MRQRDFRGSDLSEISDLIHRTIDACYASAYPPLALEFFKRFHSDAAILERAARGRVIVAVDSGAIVATGALLDGEILAVFVAPERQGEGLGGALMDRLESLALAAGRTWVRLSISCPSLGFYQRRGYRVTLECSHDLGDGQRLDYWEAEKALVRES